MNFSVDLKVLGLAGMGIPLDDLFMLRLTFF